MKVVLVSYGSQGDVRPLAAFGRALRERGVEVKVCAPPDSRSLFAAAGLPFASLGSDVRMLMTLRASVLVDRPWAAIAPMTRILQRELMQQFRQLPAEIEGADLVVGSGLALAVPSVAEACGVPHAFAVSLPIVLPSRHHAPLTIPWQGLPPVCNLVLWRLNTLVLDRVYRGFVNRHRLSLGLRPLRRLLPHLTAHLIVSADKELAPLPPEAPSGCRQTGYWHWSSGEDLPAELETFLDRGPPPVYIGFGSMGDPEPRRTATFLRQAVHRAGVRAVIQSGWAGWSFESDRDCLCVSQTLPHQRLFPRVSAVIHHGGAGTVMAAARAGRPQWVIPHLLDQYYWGRRVFKLGLGPPPVSRKRLRADVLARALERLAGSASLQARARHLAVPLRLRDGAREAARWVDSHFGGPLGALTTERPPRPAPTTERLI